MAVVEFTNSELLILVLTTVLNFRTPSLKCAPFSLVLQVVFVNIYTLDNEWLQ